MVTSFALPESPGKQSLAAHQILQIGPLSAGRPAIVRDDFSASGMLAVDAQDRRRPSSSVPALNQFVVPPGAVAGPDRSCSGGCRNDHHDRLEFFQPVHFGQMVFTPLGDWGSQVRAARGRAVQLVHEMTVARPAFPRELTRDLLNRFAYIWKKSDDFVA